MDLNTKIDDGYGVILCPNCKRVIESIDTQDDDSLIDFSSNFFEEGKKILICECGKAYTFSLSEFKL